MFGNFSLDLVGSHLVSTPFTDDGRILPVACIINRCDVSVMATLIEFLLNLLEEY